jgi:predicted hotdog family 3-hydroxylacyl-ACP dehydratase
MPGPSPIRELIAHRGAMFLLDAVRRWDATEIVCAARSHLDPDNPLRRAGRLGAMCGIEYGLQAAALHGALAAGGVPLAAGLLVALRGVALHVDRLDDPGFGVLGVTARMEGRDAGGLAYAFRLAAADGVCLVEGRGLIALPGTS